jgi:hypothetical protein
MIRTLALSAVLALAAPAFAADVTTLAGKPIKGKVVSLDAVQLTLQDAEGKEIKIPVKDLAGIDLGGKPLILGEKPIDEIELIDGTLLKVAPGSFKLKGDKGECVSLPGINGEGPAIALPLRSIYSIMRDAHKPTNKDDWKKVLANRGKRDSLVIREKLDSGDRLNQMEGTVLDGNEVGTRINFEQASSGEKVSFPLARFTGGIVFNQPPRTEIPPTLCRVADSHGNLLLANSIRLEGEGVVVVTVAGATVRYPSLNGIAMLDFRQGNVKYLAEFDPAVQSPKAIEGEPNFTFMRDKTAAGTPLRLEGRIYSKGLWVFPDTSLAFPLNGEYKTFKVVVGVDDTVQIATSSVRVIIEADGRKLFNQVVSRKDKPRELTLDVKDAKELKITVDREALYAGNQVNLAEARVQK